MSREFCEHWCPIGIDCPECEAERTGFKSKDSMREYELEAEITRLRAEVEERKKGQQIQARALLRLNAEVERLRNAAIYAHLVLDKFVTEDALIASDTLKAALAAKGE